MADLHPSVAALAPLLGTWTVEARFPALGPGGAAGRTTFAAAVGGAFVLQTAEVPSVPEAPDVHALLGPGPDGGPAFLQHYFDSRGVVRRYAMTFADGLWTLERSRPEADFGQRFAGRLTDDGATLAGAWEIERDGALVHDFDLVYRRV